MRNGPNNTTPRHYSGQFRYPRTFNRRPQFFPNHSYPPNNYFSRPRQQIIFHHHIYHNTFEQPNRSPLLNNNNNQRPNIPTPNVGVEENTDTPPQNQQTVSPLRRIVTDQYPQIVIRIPLGQIPEHARTFTDDEPETVLTQQGLSRGDIDSIESYSYESKKVVRCCICLEDFKEGDNIRVLWCQHEYHAPCVDTWLHQTPTCPVCRKSAPGRETN